MIYSAAGSHEAVLCMGSNCGDNHTAFGNALEAISGMAQVMSRSEAYLTPAMSDSPEHTPALRPYLNMVLTIETSLCREELEKHLKQMEINAGRDAECRRRGDVPLDIDIVVFDGRVIRPRDFNSGFFRKGFYSLTPCV